MTKEVKRTIHDSLEEGSSVFNINFASEGLSWVKGFCQKLETSCNEYVDNFDKYVNTAGEQLKKIYSEVCEWEKPFPTEEPELDSCLKHDCVIGMSSESSVELQESCSEEKLSGCSHTQLTESVPEDSGPTAVCSKDEVATEDVECSGEKEESLSAGAIDCLDNPEENCRESADPGIIHADPTSSSSVQCIQLVEPNSIEKRLTISESVLSEQVTVGTENVRDSNLSTSSVIIQNSKREEFEAVRLEDFCDGFEKNEVALISSRQAAKNMSFKRRLRNVFTGAKGSPMQNKVTSYDFSIPTEDPCPKLSAQDSIDSGWELL